MNIAIRVDASLRIGMGHFTRCLTLANGFKRSGSRVLFICRHMTEFMRAEIHNRGHEVIALRHRNEQSGGTLAHAGWLGVSQTADAVDTLEVLGSESFDWLVVDHYALDAAWESAMRPVVARLLAVDDIADRAHNVDLLLDQNLQDSNTDRYAGLLPENCTRLIGPRYALLRPEFRQLAAALPSVRDRINICFGGTDPDGMTMRAALAFDCPALRHVAVDMVIGMDNPHRTRIASLVKKLPFTQLHIQPPNLGALMSRARFALGAGGATSWERCCLGVPTAIVSIADNQKSGCRALARVRAAFYLGDIAQLTTDCIARTTQRLLSKPDLLAAMSRRAASLVDGRGTERVVEIMLCA